MSLFMCYIVHVNKKVLVQLIQNKSHEHFHASIPRLIFANVILWLEKKEKQAQKESHFGWP